MKSLQISLPRRGIAMILAVVVCFMVALLFLMLSRSTSQLRHVTAGVLQESQAQVFAGAAAEIVWPFVEDCLRRRSGCEKLFPTNGIATPLHPFAGLELDGFTLKLEDFQGREALEKSLDQLAKACGPTMPGVEQFAVELRWHVNASTQATAIADARRTGTLEAIIRVVFQTSRGSTLSQFGQKDVHTFSFAREFKLYQLLPSPISRFSLFVKQCSQEEFNIQQKKFQEDDGKQRILVLHNSKQPFSAHDLEAWKTSGWVYLGGERVVLNIDGSHPSRTQSEYFLFTPTTVFQPDSVQLFSFTSLFGDSPIRYGWMMLGCNEEWVTSVPMRWLIDSPFDMNRPGPVPKLVEQVSVLRLFGDKQRMTPTKVFGKVHLRGVFYGALVYDADGDGLVDYLTPVASGSGTPLASTLGAFPMVRVGSARQYPPHQPYPTLLNIDLYELFDLGNFGVPRVPESLGELIPVYEGQDLSYRNLMSMVSFEDFLPEYSSANAVYDGMYAGAGTGIDPVTKGRLKNFGNDEYPNDGRGFSLKAAWKGEPELFQGNLAMAVPTAAFQNPSYFATVFADQNEFFSAGPISAGNAAPRLERATVAKIAGDLKLPDKLVIDAPCLIVADGDITVGALESGKPGTSPNGRLVLCSLGGNIVLKGGDIGKVTLLAPAGTVTWSERLTMNGTLYAHHLLPSVIAQSGGVIEYDGECNLADPVGSTRGLTVVLGPNLPGSRVR